jgi:crotonobetainyl-CoA:carnitine CoA-transferase CaiB-like acyl-CoA transferase
MYDTSEALEDPQAKHLEILVSAKHKTMGDFHTVRPPVSFDGQRSTEVVPPPVLGEHNDEVLGPVRSRLEPV